MLRLLASALFAAPALAGQITLATWNLEWFPSGIAFKTAPEEIENARVKAAANTVRAHAPDIFFAQEIRDVESCEKLAAATGIKNFKLAVCTDFLDFEGNPIMQQCAIFTTHKVVETRSIKWQVFGIADPPRGAAYALLDVDGELLACFSLHLKSNLRRNPREQQLNILKRELAIGQLLRFISEMPPRPDGRAIKKFVVAGDFNTTLDENDYLSEGTIRNLLDDGFKNSFENIIPAKRITLPAKGLYADVTFDYIFHKGFNKQNTVRFSASNPAVSDHRMFSVVVE